MKKVESLANIRLVKKELEFVNIKWGLEDVIRPRTGYHLVDPRPWPFVASFGALSLVRRILSWAHNGFLTLELFFIAFVLLGLTIVS